MTARQQGHPYVVLMSYREIHAPAPRQWSEAPVAARLVQQVARDLWMPRSALWRVTSRDGRIVARIPPGRPRRSAHRTERYVAALAARYGARDARRVAILRARADGRSYPEIDVTWGISRERASQLWEDAGRRAIAARLKDVHARLAPRRPVDALREAFAVLAAGVA